MCGIHGVLFPRRDCRDAVRRMHAALRHRGPDDDAIADVGPSIFGHRRLSILDLSPNGAQPMWSAGRELCITFNGEIYNFAELRKECEARGLPFRSTSDTEVILNQFLIHGAAAFERLNGMFALCLFDSRTREYWLARDRAGIKPLFYGTSSDGLFFASELDALLSSNQFPLDLDQAGLQAYLRMDSVPAPMTIVRGVRKIAGGQLLRIRNLDDVEERSFVDVEDRRPRLSEQAGRPSSTFGPLIRAVVERQMVADVPVGVFLSGGIDSSIIAITASELTGRRVPMFSVAFDEPSFDERRYFEIVARSLSTDHRIEVFTAKSALDLVPQIAAIAREPLGDASLLPTFAISRFAHSEVKVILSGDGADELFGGYPTHRVWRAGRAWARLPRFLRRSVAAIAQDLVPVSTANLSFDYRLKKFLEGADRDLITQNQQWLGTFSREELRRLLPNYDAASDAAVDSIVHNAVPADLDPLDRILRADERFYMQEQVLVKVDRASMASSLEVRVPFLDNEMITFAHGLPPHLKTGKRILRHWLRDKLPAEIWRRPKKGFGIPIGRWFRNELHDLLVASIADLRGVIDETYAIKLIEQHRRGQRDRRKELYNLLALALWYRRAKEITASAQARHSVA
jgi:asparagine synthase (glutamine-hydrolysing)